MTTKNVPFHSTGRTHWRDLYRAAILETDQHKLPRRIVEVEEALIERGRELFPTFYDNLEEARAVDDALYAMRALS